MRFLTPRKRATGLGSARRGTEDHWMLTVTGIALAILAPVVVVILGTALHADRAGVIALFSRPLPMASITLFVIIGMLHWVRGTRSMIDDYTDGAFRTWALVLTRIFAWGVIAVMLVAILRLHGAAIAV